jgi:PAS domain S-box-containing protein
MFAACSAGSLIWIPVVTSVLRIALVVLMARFYTRSRTIRWLQIFTIGTIISDWATVAVGCTTDPGLYKFVVGLRDIVGIFNQAVLVIFTLYFINRAEWLSKFWVCLAILAAPMAFTMYSYMGLLTSTDITKGEFVKWGYRVAASGPMSGLQLLYILVQFFVVIYLLSWYYHKLTNPLKKREINIMRLAIVVPILIAVVFEIVLPIITKQEPFPISSAISPFVNAVAFYALWRYGLRMFNVNDVMSEVTHVMPGGLIILDASQTIQYTNRGAADLLGYKDGKLVGASIRKLLPTPPMQQQFADAVIAPLGHQNTVVVPDTTLADRTGKPLPVTLNASTVYSGREMTNIILVVTDITSLKAAEAALTAEKASVERKVRERTRELAAAQAELLASLKGLPFGMALIGTKGEVRIHNGLLGQLFDVNLSDDPIEARSQLERIDKEYAPSVHILEIIQTTQKTRKTTEKQADVGPRFYRFQFSPIISLTEQDVLGCALIVEDLTEAKILERSREEFFSIASHELRTPLTAIRGNSEMLRDYYPQVMADAEVKQMVLDMHDASVRLIQIVNDFLDTSRLEQGKIAYKPSFFDIGELMQQIVREFDVTGSRRKLALVAEPTPPNFPKMFADPDRTRQIIINLMQNSIKYTQDGSVTLRAVAEQSMIKIYIIDTGEGIPEKSQPLLFRKFMQASNNILTRDNTRSTGLGLYISRLMAEDMEGHLNLEHSEVGKGSTFVLELPHIEAKGHAKPAADSTVEGEAAEASDSPKG